MNIEIITCANTTLKETGFGTGLACDDVLASVKRMGHAALITVCESLDDLKCVVQRKPDLVILAAKYLPLFNGEDIWFSDYFECNHLIISGSSRKTLQFDSNKVLAKVHLASLGIKTASYFTAIPGQYQDENTIPLPFPLFLKPTNAANGNGIDDQSFVENYAEFKAKLQSLYNTYGQPVLAEEYLGGREFTVAIIKNRRGEMKVSAIELVPPLSTGTLRILGATVKTLDTETIKEIECEVIESVKSVATAAFLALGVRGFGRIDVKMDKRGSCYFMEANLVPGMNDETSYFPLACKIDNKIPYDEVIETMLDESIDRAFLQRELNVMLNVESCVV